MIFFGKAKYNHDIKKTILVNNIANQGRNKIIYPKINKILYILFIKYQITKRLSFGWEM